MAINSLNTVYNFNDAKALMVTELKALSGGESCYKEPDVKRIEIAVSGIDLLSWLAQQSFVTKIYGSHQTGLYSIAGVGEALVVAGDKIESYARIFERLRLYLRPEYNHLQFYGGFAFDETNRSREWAGCGAYKFVVPQFEVATKDDKMIFCCNVIRHGEGSKKIEAIIEELNKLRWNGKPLADVPVNLMSRRDQPDYEAWKRNIHEIVSEIQAKTCQKVVLARKTSFNFKDVLNPWLIMQQLKNVTPNSYHFCYQFEEKHVFLGASPERLFVRQKNGLQTEALAGTRPRGKNDSDDNRLKGELKSSGKDQHEHKLVVDMIQDALKPLAVGLKVFPQEILSFGNGHHLRTKIQALLKDDTKDEDIIAAIHPTPAVGGVPKADAIGIIRDLEGFNRGWYAGPIGYVGEEQTEFVVAIRSALILEHQLIVYAGAGIVAGSTPKGEWEEIEHKIGNFSRVVNANDSKLSKR
jgi:menaquinone-specific isochorismate synthase